jgi:hypothetical protein
MRLNWREVFERDAASYPILERQARERAAWALRAELERPLPAIPDPLRRVKVLAVFRVGTPGQMRDSVVGETISLPSTLARSLAGIGRVEIL